MRHRGGQFFGEEGTAAERSGHGLPGRVEDAIADVAVIFHWPPSAFEHMSLAELADWREHARLRSGNEDT
ncbi:GpE family phage tail protein [Chromobacterium rhizoryzae]|uniref:GpE family phage tail protein n=1 Tax=Chromobacterium rhizoryzae TaxID=1778675 RepID=A0AAD0RTT1_9NEIS|nr:GpE family phage tail protein [Chromobacterium rhizoryzae]